MLFPTTVKVFLLSVSFKALMVLKGFRNRERLGTKLELRAWAPESSSESAVNLSAVGRREEIGHFENYGSQRGKRNLDLSNRKFDFVSFNAVP